MEKIKSFCIIVLIASVTVLLMATQKDYYYKQEDKTNAYPQLMEAFQDISNAFKIEQQQVKQLLTEEEFQSNLDSKILEKRVIELLQQVKKAKYYTKENLEEIAKQYIDCYKNQIQYKNEIRQYPFIHQVQIIALSISILSLLIIVLILFRNKKMK